MHYVLVEDLKRGKMIYHWWEAIYWYLCHINFDIKYEGHQNWSKTLSAHILWFFLVTIVCDIKIDINICEPHYIH